MRFAEIGSKLVDGHLVNCDNPFVGWPMPHDEPSCHISSCFLKKNYLSWYFHCGPIPKCPKCCTHSSYGAPTHPPPPHVTAGPLHHPRVHLSLQSAITPLHDWPQCTVLIEKIQTQNSPPFTVIIQPLYLLCAKSRRNTKSKPIYVDYVYLWCDQVVSGLLANKFLVPSFENSSGK